MHIWKTIAVSLAMALTPLAAHAGNGNVFGNWSTQYVGHALTYATGDGDVYIKPEVSATGGMLTINRDGTFVWHTVGQGTINGHWRPATANELLGGFGPDGIRILHGESGWDYNVQTRRKTSPNDADSIAIWTSGYQVNGWRVK